MNSYLGTRRRSRQKSRRLHLERLESRQVLSASMFIDAEAENGLGPSSAAAEVASDPTIVAVTDRYEISAGGTLHVSESFVDSFPHIVKTEAYPAPGNVEQIEYSAEYDLLVLRNSGSAIHLVDNKTHQLIETHLASYNFTDIDLTPDGRFLFAVEWNGTNRHYDSSEADRLHRLDLKTRTWQVQQIPMSMYHVEAVSENRAVVQEPAQHVDFGLIDFSTATVLDRIAADYDGDMEFDHRTGRVYHGSSGSSSSEIHVRELVGSDLLDAGDSGIYGTAQGYGPNIVLSADGSNLYYGRLQVDALDITRNLRVFQETIYAATRDIAFGRDGYYDARSADFRGKFPFSATVYFISDDGHHVWAFEANNDFLHHFEIFPRTQHGVLANDQSLSGRNLSAVLVDPPAHGALTFDANGTFTYTTADDRYVGYDRFRYKAVSDAGESEPVEVTIAIFREDVDAPQANDDSFQAAVDTTLTISPTGAGALLDNLLETVPLPEEVVQLEYSPAFRLLYARGKSERIHVFDLDDKTWQSAATANTKFTDMDLTPDGRYLYAADDGGTAIGYGDPIQPHYVHRFDAVSREWEVRYVPTIAYRIEAVDSHRFLVLEFDQWVDLTLNSFPEYPAGATIELDRIASDYHGDIEYDHRLGRIYHGNSGLSSSEIDVMRLLDDQLVSVGDTGVYGSASGGGGSSVLSSDGRHFYYGRLQVEALDVRNNLRSFPESILAASGRYAFSASHYYDAVSGQELGTLGTNSNVYFVSDDGNHLWTLDSDNRARHYALESFGGVLLNDFDLQGDRLTAIVKHAPQHGHLTLHADGSFQYVPYAGFQGIDQFGYVASDGNSDSELAIVSINVGNASGTPPPIAMLLSSDRVYENWAGWPIAEIDLIVSSRPMRFHFPVRRERSFSETPARRASLPISNPWRTRPSSICSPKTEV